MSNNFNNDYQNQVTLNSFKNIRRNSTQSTSTASNIIKNENDLSALNSNSGVNTKNNIDNDEQINNNRKLITFRTLVNSLAADNEENERELKEFKKNERDSFLESKISVNNKCEEEEESSDRFLLDENNIDKLNEAGFLDLTSKSNKVQNSIGDYENNETKKREEKITKILKTTQNNTNKNEKNSDELFNIEKRDSNNLEICAKNNYHIELKNENQLINFQSDQHRRPSSISSSVSLLPSTSQLENSNVNLNLEHDFSSSNNNNNIDLDDLNEATSEKSLQKIEFSHLNDVEEEQAENEITSEVSEVII